MKISKINQICLISVAMHLLLKCMLFSYAIFRKENYTNFISLWKHWDGVHYINIALNFYPSDKPFCSHFPPLYPILSKALSYILNIDIKLAAFLIAFSSSLLIAYFLAKLIYLEFGSYKKSILGVLFFSIYPTSYFTNSIYSESPFILLSILVFYNLRIKKSLLLASLFTFLAILTRNIGVCLIPILFFHLFKHRKIQKINFRNIAICFFPVLAILIYLYINYYYYEDVLFAIKRYEGTRDTLTFGFIPFAEAFSLTKVFFEKLVNNKLTYSFIINQGFPTLFTLFSLILCIMGFIKKIPFEYSLYNTIYLLFFSSFTWAISTPRFSLAMFPIFIVLAHTKKTTNILILTSIFIILLLLFTKIFISSRWAF